MLARHAEFYGDALTAYICRKYGTAVDQADIFRAAVRAFRAAVGARRNSRPDLTREQHRIVHIPKQQCIFLHAVLYF